MSIVPKILDNPENPIFCLSESETYSLKEVKELIDIEKYSYSLFALWNCIITNIQRRIEKFGIKNFLNVYEYKNNFNLEGNNLKDRWLNINEYDLIDYASKINVINHTSHDLITTLYWMKTETNENKENTITKDEILALIFLLEKNLFIKEFKIDKRTKQIEQDRRETNRGGRRKIDREELISTATLNSKTPSTTHQELFLKSTTKIFEENNKNFKKSGNLLNSYI